MDNTENLSPEELASKKEEMLKFYKDSMPYLQAQFDYEELLSQIDEMRLKRTQIQMAYAQMMAPPEEEENPSMEAVMPEPKEAGKKRKLKTKA